MKIGLLHRENQKVEIAGKEYLLAPYHIATQMKISAYYESKGRDDGLNYAIAVLSAPTNNQEYINVLMEVLYLFIVEPPFSIDEFKKDLGEKVRIEEVAELVAKVIMQAQPIVEQEKKKRSKTPVIIIGIFSLVGLTATIYWLVAMVIAGITLSL